MVEGRADAGDGGEGVVDVLLRWARLEGASVGRMRAS